MVKLTYIGQKNQLLNVAGQTVEATVGLEKEFDETLAEALLDTGQFIRTADKITRRPKAQTPALATPKEK